MPFIAFLRGLATVTYAPSPPRRSASGFSCARVPDVLSRRELFRTPSELRSSLPWSWCPQRTRRSWRCSSSHGHQLGGQARDRPPPRRHDQPPERAELLPDARAHGRPCRGARGRRGGYELPLGIGLALGAAASSAPTRDPPGSDWRCLVAARDRPVPAPLPGGRLALIGAHDRLPSTVKVVEERFSDLSPSSASYSANSFEWRLENWAPDVPLRNRQAPLKGHGLGSYLAAHRRGVRPLRLRLHRGRLTARRAGGLRAQRLPVPRRRDRIPGASCGSHLHRPHFSMCPSPRLSRRAAPRDGPVRGGRCHRGGQRLRRRRALHRRAPALGGVCGAVAGSAPGVEPEQAGDATERDQSASHAARALRGVPWNAGLRVQPRDHPDRDTRTRPAARPRRLRRGDYAAWSDLRTQHLSEGGFGGRSWSARTWTTPFSGRSSSAWSARRGGRPGCARRRRRCSLVLRRAAPRGRDAVPGPDDHSKHPGLLLHRSAPARDALRPALLGTARDGCLLRRGRCSGGPFGAGIWSLVAASPRADRVRAGALQLSASRPRPISLSALREPLRHARGFVAGTLTEFGSNNVHFVAVSSMLGTTPWAFTRWAIGSPSCRRWARAPDRRGHLSGRRRMGDEREHRGSMLITSLTYLCLVGLPFLAAIAALAPAFVATCSVRNGTPWPRRFRCSLLGASPR